MAVDPEKRRWWRKLPPLIRQPSLLVQRGSPYPLPPLVPDPLNGHHRTTLPIPLELLGVTWRPLAQGGAVEVGEAVSRAVALAANPRPEIVALLRRLDVAAIRDVQDRVVRGEIPLVF